MHVHCNGRVSQKPCPNWQWLVHSNASACTYIPSKSAFSQMQVLNLKNVLKNAHQIGTSNNLKSIFFSIKDSFCFRKIGVFIFLTGICKIDFINSIKKMYI